MRIFIYLLAMLTGFSAAQAARPDMPVRASVDAAVARDHAASAVKAAEQVQEQPALDRLLRVEAEARLFVVGISPEVSPATPVQRHDVALA